MLYRTLKSGAEPRRGVVLIAVLIVIVLLTLAASQYSELMMAEYKAAVSFTKAAQVRSAADSGLNYASLVLSDPTAFQSILNGNPYDNSSVFAGIPVGMGTGTRRVYFTVVAPVGPDDAASGVTTIRYGATDESGKINLNSLLKWDSSGALGVQILTNLGIDPDTANAIMDWMDPDSTTRQGGAEEDYYAPLGYHCKNAQLDTLDEMLFIKGVTPDLLYGTDVNRNGILDTEEQANSGGQLSLGWQAYLTIYSREQNVDSTGNPRLYINTVNTQTLSQKLTTAVGQEMANYILAYRRYPSATVPGGPNVRVLNQKATDLTSADLKLSVTDGGRNLSSLFELIGSEVVITTSSGRETTVRRIPCPLNDTSRVQDLLPALLDKLTTVTTQDLPARVNVNTAPQAVLAALPGLSPTDVSAIIAAQPKLSGTSAPDPKFQSIAWLLSDANLKPAALKTLDRFVTARTQVYRVQVIGHFANRGPTSRIEAVIDTNRGRPRIVYLRDLSELGRAFDLPTPTMGGGQ